QVSPLVVRAVVKIVRDRLTSQDLTFSSDSDGDGVPDEIETAIGYNPFAADTDADGRSDSQELGTGTDPLRADTDEDGLPDGFEIQTGLNPLDPSDATQDPDRDGLTNLQEYARGSDPFNSDTTAPFVTDIIPAPGSRDFRASGVITVRFSEPLRAETVSRSSVKLFAGNLEIAG